MIDLHDLILETLNIFESEDIKQLEKERMRLYMKVKNWKRTGKDTSELEIQLNDAKKRLSDAKKVARLATKGAVVTPQQSTPTGDDSVFGDLGTEGFGSLDIDLLMNRDNKEIIKINVERYLMDNYNIQDFEIGKLVEIRRSGEYYIVSSVAKRIVATNKYMDALTNGMFKFGNVKAFSCATLNNLTSLEGAPEVSAHFDCSECNKLTSLEGAPRKCDYFDCSECKSLTSLKGAPQVCNNFSCIGCICLTSLEGSPKECHAFDIQECKKITSLKGAPEKCKYFYCDDCNSLKSLKYAPKYCISFSCRKTGITDLEGLPNGINTLTCSGCDNLISLKGCPKKLKYLYALYCRNLTDKTHLPSKVKLVEKP